MQTAGTGPAVDRPCDPRDARSGDQIEQIAVLLDDVVVPDAL